MMNQSICSTLRGCFSAINYRLVTEATGASQGQMYIEQMGYSSGAFIHLHPIHISIKNQNPRLSD